MKNWTIAQRVAAGGAALIMLLIAVGASCVIAFRNINHEAKTRLADDALPGINSMAEIAATFPRIHIRTIMAAVAKTEAQREAFIQQSNETRAVFAAALDTYEANVTSTEDRAQLEELKKRRDAYFEARNNYLELAKAGKADEAEAYLLNTLDVAYSNYRSKSSDVLKWNQQIAQSVSDNIVTLSVRATTVASIVSAAALLIGLALGWFIIRAVNQALRITSSQLDEGAEQVASAANQVSGSSQSLAEGASEQAASLEETGASLEELSSMTKRNATSANSAKTLSAETRVAAEAGDSAMTEMRQAMEAIKTSSNDIAKIIKSIDEIAFQTNILALNAAVEAARAGEAGAGFAVVAEEVRALAQRSANSAKETAEKIDVAIRNGDHGVAISEKVASSLGVIVSKARQVDQLVAEIATASDEQNQGILQINGAVSQMDKVTQANASNAEETAAAAEELNSQAAMMRDSVLALRRLVDGGGNSNSSAKPTTPVAHSAAPRGRTTEKTVPKTSSAARPPTKPIAAGVSAKPVDAKAEAFFKDM